MNQRHFLYVFTTGPYSNASGQEGLDAMLMGAAFELNVSALFIHDGVFQLKTGQDTGSCDLKQYTRAFRALNDFGVKNIYVLDTSLKSRGLDGDCLTVRAKILDSQGVVELLKQQQRVFTF